MRKTHRFDQGSELVLAFPYGNEGREALDILAYRTVSDLNPLIYAWRIREGKVVDPNVAGAFCEEELLLWEREAHHRRLHFGEESKVLHEWPGAPSPEISYRFQGQIPLRVVSKRFIEGEVPRRVYVFDSFPGFREDRQAVEEAFAYFSEQEVRHNFSNGKQFVVGFVYGFPRDESVVRGMDVLGYKKYDAPNVENLINPSICSASIEDETRMDVSREGGFCETEGLILVQETRHRREALGNLEKVCGSYPKLPLGFEAATLL